MTLYAWYVVFYMQFVVELIVEFLISSIYQIYSLGGGLLPMRYYTVVETDNVHAFLSVM